MKKIKDNIILQKQCADYGKFLIKGCLPSSAAFLLMEEDNYKRVNFQLKKRYNA